MTTYVNRKLFPDKVVNGVTRKRKRRVLPGLPLTLGLTVTYLSLIVLIPLSASFIKTAGLTWDQFVQAAFSPRVLNSYKVSFMTSGIAATINSVFGLLVAWVLVRYRFPGRRLIDGIVDLPFALPTAVAGIALTTIYAKNGWVGSLLNKVGIEGAFSVFGITVALTFVSLPFVVRTVQPILEDLDKEQEEASATLGASRFTTFWRVIFPAVLPALITGFAMAFARAIGEYGSVVFISGNKPMSTEIAPLMIASKLEAFDYAGATAIATVMLVISFTLLLVINLLQRWARARITEL